MKNISEKIVGIGLVGLLLVVSFAVAEDSIGPYNPIADVNRDGIVDILDLVEVGQAYGSNLTLPSEPNKTVVTVLSYVKDPSRVKDARVAIFGDCEGYSDTPVAVQYTNSSGISTFMLSPNSSYTAIAWSGSLYNYANVTTDFQGEASVVIWLGLSSKLPRRTIVFTYLNNETGFLAHGIFVWFDVYECWWNSSSEQLQLEWRDANLIVPEMIPIVRHNVSQALDRYFPNTPYTVGHDINQLSNYTIAPPSVFQTDEDLCASVIVYAYAPS